MNELLAFLSNPLHALLMGIIALLPSLLSRELHDMSPHFAEKIAAFAARLMPSNQEEWGQIWKADIQKAPGKLWKLRWALGFLIAPWGAWKDELTGSPFAGLFYHFAFKRNIEFFTMVTGDTENLTEKQRGLHQAYNVTIKLAEGDSEISEYITNLPPQESKKLFYYAKKVGYIAKFNQSILEIAESPKLNLTKDDKVKVVGKRLMGLAIIFVNRRREKNIEKG